MKLADRLSRCIAVALCLYGVGGAARAETLKVYWNAGHAYQAYADVIKKFESDHPGWTVEWGRFQWPDMRTKLVADLSVGNAPDLVAEPGGWVPEFALQGMITPLNDFVAKDGKDLGYPQDWQDFSVDRNTIDGKYYGIQLHLTCATLVYNVDMLKEAGFHKPPTNWQEFRKVAIATSKRGKFGFAPNQVATYYTPWIYQNGGALYDSAANKVAFDSPQSAQAIQFVADLIHKDKAAPLPVAGADYEGPQKLFTAGRAAMILTGPWDVSPIKTGNPKLNWDVAPSLTEKQQATMSGGVSLFIPKTAKHPAEAWDLLKRFVTLETELAASLPNGMTMPRKSWAADPKVKADPVLGKFSQCLPYAVDSSAKLSLTGKNAAVQDLFKAAIQDILYNDKPAQEVLSDYAGRANAALGHK
ncbi:sugar ABC transporter substrate-binding protein [Rhizobium sp. SEMIA 4085]|uniref:Sugar ABC transporter substrate-binding protein n=1 Tax=Rhizobium gallicum bv. gallicum R602sp TaxID=1041138 RepID=A0A0B4XH36_9HYPH|nr:MULTISPECIES: sugar ABC transporter substrate-binding protein [Rhizobium]AJD45757.1 sugar ABC transporter substrate-binding protein [Rhizobium gallicum bv. gallicum R602sp]NNH29759.1 sugar ABC transporter substrate-binding protein [Rhizobium sp. SEMIA 4085]